MPKLLTTLAGKIVAGIVLLAIIGFGAWFFFVRPVSLHRDIATAKAAETVSEAHEHAATDAIHITAATAAKAAATDATTERSSIAIITSPGADTALDPALHTAGLRALCLRDDVSDPRCADVLHGHGGSVGADKADSAHVAP